MKVMLVAGVLVAAGAVAAVSASGPRGSGGFLDGIRDGISDIADRVGERLDATDADGPRSRGERRRRDRTAARDRNGDSEFNAAEFEADDQERGDRRTRRGARRGDDRNGDAGSDDFARRGGARFDRRESIDDAEASDEAPRGRDRSARRSAELSSSEDEAEPHPRGPAGMQGRGVERGARWERLDRNGDGVIDKAEFEAAAAERIASASQRFFKRFDANRDGRVTRDEFDRPGKERSAMRDDDGDARADAEPVPAKRHQVQPR